MLNQILILQVFFNNRKILQATKADIILSSRLKRPFDFEKWVEKLTKNRIDILKSIHENSRISIRELSIVSGLSLSAIDKNLLFLKELGLLERMNGAKGGYWIIHYKLP